MAPPYAILFMADLEERFLEQSSLKPLVWWRYIDDIFMLWQHGQDSLDSFLEALNDDKTHKTIKFTSTYSKERINFLDVDVMIQDNKVLTDLYIKETDTHQYLDFHSCHPIHCKTSLPFSQALRLNRICSEPQFFDHRCNQLEEWFFKRGYSPDLVRKKVLAARKMKRDELLFGEKKEREKGRIIFNINYHPALASLGKVLQKIQGLLACNKEHQKVFSQVPVLGFRKGKSLKDLLVRAKVPSLQAKQVGRSTSCGSSRCKVCHFVKDSDSFADNKGNKYQIRSGTMDCNSDFVVYLLSCKTCKIQYVGSCTTKFRLRFNNYKSCHNRCKTQTVGKAELHDHFCQSDHKGLEDWEFTLIDRGSGLESVRKKEMFWQYKLSTFKPNCLNDR